MTPARPGEWAEGLAHSGAFFLATCSLSLGIPLGVSIPGGVASAAITAVPCNTNGPGGTADPSALISAISGAASGDTLSLAAGCTYTLSAVNNSGYPYNAAAGSTGLPLISQNLPLKATGPPSLAPRTRALQTSESSTSDQVVRPSHFLI